MGNNKRDVALPKYTPVATTTLEPNFPTFFWISDYFKKTTLDRIKDYEDEFEEIGLTTEYSRNGRERLGINQKKLLSALDRSMQKYECRGNGVSPEFLVTVNSSKYLGFNVDVSDHIICTIHPAFLGVDSVGGLIHSVKTDKDPSSREHYRNIALSMEKVDWMPYQNLREMILAMKKERRVRFPKPYTHSNFNQYTGPRAIA